MLFTICLRSLDPVYILWVADPDILVWYKSGSGFVDWLDPNSFWKARSTVPQGSILLNFSIISFVQNYNNVRIFQIFGLNFRPCRRFKMFTVFWVTPNINVFFYSYIIVKTARRKRMLYMMVAQNLLRACDWNR